MESRIAAACRSAGRPRSSVRLIAVSKNFGAEAVREAVRAGQIEFGENRFQEAEPKIAALAGSGPQLLWHFLGRIQTNKLGRILEAFSTVQSVDRIEVLEKAERFLSLQNIRREALLEVCISDEGTKAGFEPEALRRWVRSDAPARYQNLKIRGLMGIAPHDMADRARVRRSFDLLKSLYDESVRAGMDWDTLSMGMSGDLEEAIAAGSTMVRVGTSIFGSRVDTK